MIGPTRLLHPSVRRARPLALPISICALAATSILAVVLTGTLSLPSIRSAGAAHRLFAARGGSASSSPRPTLTIAPAPLGPAFAPGAIGLSIEAQELASNDLQTNRAPVPLMRLLGPGVLRIGGNSVDRSWWTSRGEPPPKWATRVLTPANLLGLRRLLAATHWRAILGVNLGHFEPARAAEEVASAQRTLGRYLLGIEIGNEPHTYSAPWMKLRSGAYSPSNYLNELSAYTTAIRGVSSSIALYGPELSSPPWLKAVAASSQNPFTELTAHYYPTYYSVPGPGCPGTSLPTAADLLSPQIRQQETAWLESLVADGQLAHRPVRISETNTTASCDASGAPQTGPVFASALWALDWTLRAASTGVAALDFHGSFKACTSVSFSPVCARHTRTGARVGPAPEYYGMWAARQLEGGRFVGVEISDQQPTSDITAYATEHPDGELTLAIDNFSSDGSMPLIVSAPGYRQAVGVPLVAPSVGARARIALGHGSIDANGIRRARQSRLEPSGGGFHLTVRPSSAMIVTLRKSAR